MVLQVQCEGDFCIIVPQVSPCGGQQYKFLYFCASRNEDTDESHTLRRLEKIILKICMWKVKETKSEYFCNGAAVIPIIAAFSVVSEINYGKQVLALLLKLSP